MDTCWNVALFVLYVCHPRSPALPQVEKSQQQLAAELSAAKERCHRTLSAQPQRPARSAPHAPEFQEFALQVGCSTDLLRMLHALRC